jgi:hypothetical protein
MRGLQIEFNVVENFEADFGGTDIFSHLSAIFNLQQPPKDQKTHTSIY